MRNLSEKASPVFERLRNILPRRPPAGGVADPVAQWATGLFLRHRAMGPHQFQVVGRLHDRPFQAECLASSRAYIAGLELRARVDLGLPPAGHVIVMSRVVKAGLEAQADTIYRQAVDDVQTSAHDLPQEVRWLSMFRSTPGGHPNCPTYGHPNCSTLATVI